MKRKMGDVFSTALVRQAVIPQAIGSRRKLSSSIAVAITGVSMLSVSGVQAADAKKSVQELQAEVERLTQELAAAKKREQDLINKSAAAAPAGTAPPVAAEAPAAVEAPATEVAQAEPEETKDLGEVVVRARPKLEKLHNIKQSVSVVSGKELDRELSLDLGAITRRASNVQFNQNNTRGASLSIRGVGKRSFTETQDPSVGVTVDGVSYALTQLANFDFYDVDAVEVTRGPRGTEGGLSASSGKVNVYSKLPTFIPTAELSAAYGQREALILKGALGGGVIDDFLATRISFLVDKGRGFYTQSYDDNYSLYNKDRLSGRVQFLFTPSENFKARVGADFEPRQPQLQNGLTFYHDNPFRFADGSLVDPNGTQAKARLFGFTNNAGVFTGPRPYFENRGFTWADYIGGEQRKTVNFNENQGQTVSNKGAYVQLDWDVAGHRLSSNTAVRSYSFDAHNDEGTPFDINLDGGGGVNYNQYTQEFKIIDQPGGFIDYRAGLFGIQTRNDIVSKTGWGADAGAWLATNAQYNTLDRNAGENRGSGLALLKDALQDARKKGDTEVHTYAGSIFGESDLHFTDAFTLTTGLRVTKEHRRTVDTVQLAKNGAGGALNPVSVRDVQLGGFDSATNGELQGANSADQLKLADSVANRYFGAAVTDTPGQAYNSLTEAQKNQVGTAKRLRSQQIGQLYNPVKSTYTDLLFTAQVTPSYKINNDLTTYLSWQYGEKSGSALNVNGVSRNVKPENTHALELGLKSFWLDKSLILNVDAFVMDIHNYQQTVQVVDQFQTDINIANGQANPTAYTSAQGNVKKVRVHGVELDSVYNGIPNLSLRFNGAYNIGKYIDYDNAGKPEELAYLPEPYIDQSGRILPGASKWSFTVGAEYVKPVYDKYLFHTSVNTNFQSGYNNADNLSAYGWVNSRSLTDAAIGIGTKNNVLDLSFIVKNLFNNATHEEGWNSYSPNPYPLWYGVQLSGKI
ncbi:TonB-dependent receptor plug domain-containing protein [Methylobacter sp. Wu1]|uniref:TonB-dependent receptor n=1 Tax=Methylobacter sp. Wu1 TaxID=3119359 RepID=UPI002F93D42B